MGFFFFGGGGGSTQKNWLQRGASQNDMVCKGGGGSPKIITIVCYND